MGAGIGAEGDAVAIDVGVAAEEGAGLEHLRRHHLAAVDLLRVVPLEGLDQPFLHADVEIEHDEDGGLQAVGQVEGLCAHGEAFAGVCWQQQ